MIKHLPFNEWDIGGITNAVNRYKLAGLKADFDMDGRDTGVVRIIFLNPMRSDGSLVAYDVHKIAKTGWFRTKPHWVVQLWSKGYGDVYFMRRGCVSGSIQAAAITEADLDLRHGFLSIGDLELMSRT